MTLIRLFCCLFILGLTTYSRADLILDLRLDDATRSRTVAPGEIVALDIFLVDTDATSALATSGLVGGGGRIFDAASNISAIGALASPGPGFTGPSSSPAGPGIASAQVAAGFLSVVPAVMAGPGVTVLAEANAVEVLLARFSITASTNPGDTHFLTAGPLGGGLIGNQAGPPTLLALDPFLTASGATESVSLQVRAVPEPSTFICCIIGSGFCIYRQKRKKKGDTDIANEAC